MTLNCIMNRGSTVHVGPCNDTEPAVATTVLIHTEHRGSTQSAIELTGEDARALAKHILSLLPPEANEG